MISLLAADGARSLATALPTLVRLPNDRVAREGALYGAWLCGFCLGNVDMALHHKLCHTLGGLLNLPHAETHTIMLPHTLAYNAPAVPDAMLRLAEALKEYGQDAISALNQLLKQLGVKRALKDLGMREEDIGTAAEMAVKSPYNNPRAIDLELLKEVLRRAWSGEDARADL